MDRFKLVRKPNNSLLKHIILFLEYIMLLFEMSQFLLNEAFLLFDLGHLQIKFRLIFKEFSCLRIQLLNSGFHLLSLGVRVRLRKLFLLQMVDHCIELPLLQQNELVLVLQVAVLVMDDGLLDACFNVVDGCVDLRVGLTNLYFVGIGVKHLNLRNRIKPITTF